MEAHGSPVAGIAHKLAGLLPDKLAPPMMENLGVSKLAALYSAIEIVRRGGTISLSGVYGGAADPLPRCSCSTSRSRCVRDRPTSRHGSMTSCRC